MADRKAELERKKARLEQMRRERKEKELSKKGKEVIICIFFIPRMVCAAENWFRLA